MGNGLQKLQHMPTIDRCWRWPRCHEGCVSLSSRLQPVKCKYNGQFRWVIGRELGDGTKICSLSHFFSLQCLWHPVCYLRQGGVAEWLLELEVVRQNSDVPVKSSESTWQRIRDSRFENRDSRFEIRGSRFEVQDSRFENRNSRIEIQDPRSEIRGSRSEIRHPRIDTPLFKICNLQDLLLVSDKSLDVWWWYPAARISPLHLWPLQGSPLPGRWCRMAHVPWTDPSNSKQTFFSDIFLGWFAMEHGSLIVF